MKQFGNRNPKIKIEFKLRTNKKHVESKKNIKLKMII